MSTWANIEELLGKLERKQSLPVSLTKESVTRKTDVTTVTPHEEAKRQVALVIQSREFNDIISKARSSFDAEMVRVTSEKHWYPCGMAIVCLPKQWNTKCDKRTREFIKHCKLAGLVDNGALMVSSAMSQSYEAWCSACEKVVETLESEGLTGFTVRSWVD